MKRLQPFFPALGIFGLALVVRIVYNLTVGRGYIPQYDSQVYEKIALHLLQEHCFCQDPLIATTGRAPLWPVTIASIYDFFGQSNLTVRLFLSVVGSGTCLLVYQLAKGIFNERIALLAGALAALYPGLFIYDGWLYSESLYTFLLLAFCYSLYLVQQTSRYRWMVCGGICLGLLSLTRPNGPIVFVLVVLWAIVAGRAKMLPWRTLAIHVATIALISLLFVAPWTIRNYSVSHQFVPVATGDGTVLLGAYNYMILDNTIYKGIWIRPSLTFPHLYQQYPDCGATCEPRRDTVFKNMAGQWVEGHLIDMPYLLGLHFINMWTPATPEADLPMNQFPDRLSSQVVAGADEYMSIAVFILAAIGLLTTWRKWRQLLFLYLLILLTIGECLYYYGSSRFRAPIEPILILLVAGACWWFTEKFTKLRVGVNLPRVGARPTPTMDEPTPEGDPSSIVGHTGALTRPGFLGRSEKLAEVRRGRRGGDEGMGPLPLRTRMT